MNEKFDDWLYDHLPGPIYRLPYRVKDFFRSIKFLLQKIFRKHHTSDMELWNLYIPLARHIYPKLLAFKNAKRNSFPMDFDDEYGDGGGPDRWEEVLNEMLFAFEYILADESKKEKFFRKWKLENPEEVKESNLLTSYHYEDENGNRIMSDEISEEKMKEKGYTFLKKEEMYYNMNLEKEYGERVQRGMEYFGKYFLDLWD